MMVYIMKTIAGFEIEEYEKMMAALGLLDRESAEAEEDTTDYFDAWHFGQPDEAGKYVFCSTL